MSERRRRWRLWTQNDKCFHCRWFFLCCCFTMAISFSAYTHQTTHGEYRNKYCFLYDANFISKSEWRRRRRDVDIRIAINILRIFDQLNYIRSSEYRRDVMRDIAACLLSSLSPMSNDSNFSTYNVPSLQSHINKFFFFLDFFTARIKKSSPYVSHAHTSYYYLLVDWNCHVEWILIFCHFQHKKAAEKLPLEGWVESNKNLLCKIRLESSLPPSTWMKHI